MNSARHPAGIEFLRTEVETAMVFVGIASSAKYPEKRARNLAHARKGYDTLLHFLGQLRLTADEREEMTGRISELRHKLAALGEAF